MHGLVFSGAADSPAGAQTTVFDLSTGSGLTLLDTLSGLDSHSFSASGLQMTTSTVATSLFQAPNAAPIFQAKLTREGYAGVRAIARVHVVSAGGTFPEVFLSVALDSDTLSTSQSHVGLRSGYGFAIKYNGNSFGQGPAVTAQQLTDGLWVMLDAGGTGGHSYHYSLQNTSDVSSISWSQWPNSPWDTTGWPVGANNAPGSAIRLGIGVSDLGTGATQITGRISYLSVTTVGSLT